MSSGKSSIRSAALCTFRKMLEYELQAHETDSPQGESAMINKIAKLAALTASFALNWGSVGSAYMAAYASRLST